MRAVLFFLSYATFVACERGGGLEEVPHPGQHPGHQPSRQKISPGVLRTPGITCSGLARGAVITVMPGVGPNPRACPGYLRAYVLSQVGR